MMKKLLIPALLAGLPGAAAAQGLSIGLRAGMNVSTLQGSFPQDDLRNFREYRRSLNAAILLEVELSKHFSLQPELQYTEKGNDYAPGTPLPSGHRFNRLEYLGVPLLAKYRPLPWLFVQAGPQLDYLVGAPAGPRYYPLSGKADFVSNRRLYRPLDLGYALGLGVQVRSVLLDLRYNQSLMSIARPSYPGKVRNSVFQASVGYVLRLRNS